MGWVAIARPHSFHLGLRLALVWLAFVNFLRKLFTWPGRIVLGFTNTIYILPRDIRGSSWN